ncbi:MAG: amidohydrolase family protein [Clostridiaceae bacterium]
MMVIDAHCHLGKGFEKELQPETLISIMDKNHVEKAVVCPIEQYIAVYNEEGNEYILQQVKKYEDRFIGFAAVNPWYMQKSADMLKKYLEKGLKGLKLNPKLQGFLLNSSLVKPLIRVAEEYRIPVYFHTGTLINSEPFQLRELALEFPKVNFIMGHSGNTDFWTDVAYSVKGVRNIYLETSHNLGIMGLIDAAGIDRVIFGSNMPRSHQTHELKKILDLGLSGDDLLKLCYLNIKKLAGDDQ